MSCGDERPCNRCVDRGIGHLCCDGERKPRPAQTATKRTKIDETRHRSKSIGDSAMLYYSLHGSPMLPFSPQVMQSPPNLYNTVPAAPMNPYAQSYYWESPMQHAPAPVAADYQYQPSVSAAYESGDISYSQGPIVPMRSSHYVRSRSMPGFGSHDPAVYATVPAGSTPAGTHSHDLSQQQYSTLQYSSYQTPTDVSVSHTTADEASYGNSYSSPADESPVDEHHHLHHQQTQPQYYSNQQQRYMSHDYAATATHQMSTLDTASYPATDSSAASSRQHLSYGESLSHKHYAQPEYPESDQLMMNAFSSSMRAVPVASSTRYDYSNNAWDAAI